MGNKKASDKKTAAKWGFTSKEPVFDPAMKMLDPPMEITHGMIRVLRMIDESVVVHGRPDSLSSDVNVAPIPNRTEGSDE